MFHLTDADYQIFCYVYQRLLDGSVKISYLNMNISIYITYITYFIYVHICVCAYIILYIYIYTYAGNKFSTSCLQSPAEGHNLKGKYYGTELGFLFPTISTTAVFAYTDPSSPVNHDSQPVSQLVSQSVSQPASRRQKHCVQQYIPSPNASSLKQATQFPQTNAPTATRRISQQSPQS